MPKTNFSFKRISRKLICAILIVSFLSLSTPAAPQEVTGWTVGTYQDLRFRFLSSQLAIDGPGWLAAFFAGGDSKSRRTSREIERIQIYPGSISVESGQEAVFSAVAYDRNGEPLSGINFNWHSSEAESGHLYNDVRGGLFKATEVGIFRVKARARGREGEVLVTVIPRVIRPDGTPIRSTSPRTGLGPVIGISSGDGMVSVVKGGAADTKPNTPRKDDQTVNNLLPGEGWDDTNWTSADDPGNQTGNPPGGPADEGAGNGNFQISAPVVSLPGRGIDLALNLNYNSRLWNKAGSQITYDIDYGYPAPGWSLGFGRIMFMGAQGGCMMLDADGTRHGYTGSVSSWSTGAYFTGHTADGTFIDYGCSFTYGSNGSGWAKLPNGTTISYSTTYPANGHVVPTRITDAQGNYITITYRYEPGEKINTITDTLGRVITFHYDTHGRLIEVKAPRMEDQDPIYGTATTRTVVKLHYKSLALNYSFLGVTPVVRNHTPWAIDAIYYPATNTGYWFGADPNAPDYNTYYSSYGMIRKVIEQRGMSWSAGPDEQGTVAQGTVTKQAEYNYPLTTTNQSGHTNGVNLGDAPTYTELKERWHDGVNLTAEAVTTYEVNNNDSWWDPEVMVSNPARSIKIVQPTGVISKQYTHRNPGSWSDGVLFRDETKIIDGGVEKIVASSNVGWQPGNYDSPRPQAVAAVDENGHKVTTEYTYGTGKFNQVTQSCDKDNFGTTFRCAEVTYLNTTNYIGYFNTSGNFVSGRHIFNLITSTKVKNPSGTVVSRTDYEYDNGSLQETPGVVQHLASHNPHDTSTYTCDCGWSCDPVRRSKQTNKNDGYRLMSPPDCPDGSPPWWVCQQCPVFDASTNYRGNVTKVNTYADAATPSGGIEETRAYDITGNVVTVSSSCCEQTTILYDDPLTLNDIDTQYAYPVSQTRGSPDPNSPHRITTSQTYDFNSGLVTSSIDANGRPTTTWYNPDTMRPDKTVASTGAYTTFAYNESDMTITEEVFEQGGAAAGKTKKYLNGIGQVRKAESYLPGTSTVDIVETQYTLFGEESKTSRPYRSGDTVYWTEKVYDAQRRLKKVVEPDGSTTEAFYNEAAYPDSATLVSGVLPPGNRIRVMDAWGRERWGRYDQQGRLVEVVEPSPDRSPNANPTGSIFTPGSLVTKYSYDALGRLTQSDQGGQLRKFKYDDLGRLTRQKLAEQTATLNDSGVYIGAGQTGANWANAFFYDSRSNLIQKTDARGVKALYSYHFWGGGLDPLNRLQFIQYDLSGPHDTSNPINWAPASYFTYMTTGDKTRVQMIDTEYMVNQQYEYDAEGRVSKFAQRIKYREDYPMELDYLYDTLDRVTEVKYPKEYGISGSPRKIVLHEYDTASRLKKMSYGTTGSWTQHAGDIVYNASDQTTQIKIGPSGTHQVTEDYTFDPQTGLLTRQQATKNSSLFIDLSYDYARNNAVGSLNGKTGHLTKITDNLNGARNREYEFDVLGRLVKAKGGPTGNLWDQTYTYDRYGNRLNVAANGVAADNSPIPIDGIPNLAYDNATNRITTGGYQYDVNGNMIRSLAEDGSTWVKYEYDAANRLNIIRKDDVNQTQLERFQYDHTNARVQSHDPDADVYKSYLNAGGTTVAEFIETTTNMPKWSKSYTRLGDSQLATITPDAGYTGEVVDFNHPDRLGTKTITNQGAGTSSDQAHLPFGRPLDAESSLTTNNKRFTSYDRSDFTKLDYAMNRTYDSKLGRFTQVDPIGMQSASLTAPQTLNLYAYCINDPVNYVDPSGLFLGSFFRWLGRVLFGLFRSRVARRIAVRFIVNFALSGGNFGVAIRSVIPDILRATGIFPDPRSTVPWYPGSRLPISLGTSSLSKYIIYNFLSAARDNLTPDQILAKVLPLILAALEKEACRNYIAQGKQSGILHDDPRETLKRIIKGRNNHRLINEGRFNPADPLNAAQGGIDNEIDPKTFTWQQKPTIRLWKPFFADSLSATTNPGATAGWSRFKIKALFGLHELKHVYSGGAPPSHDQAGGWNDDLINKCF